MQNRPPKKAPFCKAKSPDLENHLKWDTGQDYIPGGHPQRIHMVPSNFLASHFAKS